MIKNDYDKGYNKGFLLGLAAGVTIMIIAWFFVNLSNEMNKPKTNDQTVISQKTDPTLVPADSSDLQRGDRGSNSPANPDLR